MTENGEKRYRRIGTCRCVLESLAGFSLRTCASATGAKQGQVVVICGFYFLEIFCWVEIRCALTVSLSRVKPMRDQWTKEGELHGECIRID
jgi:hypothetical protein